jgi:hypothetical protein
VTLCRSGPRPATAPGRAPYRLRRPRRQNLPLEAVRLVCERSGRSVRRRIGGGCGLESGGPLYPLPSAVRAAREGGWLTCTPPAPNRRRWSSGRGHIDCAVNRPTRPASSCSPGSGSAATAPQPVRRDVLVEPIRTLCSISPHRTRSGPRAFHRAAGPTSGRRDRVAAGRMIKHYRCLREESAPRRPGAPAVRADIRAIVRAAAADLAAARLDRVRRRRSRRRPHEAVLGMNRQACDAPLREQARSAAGRDPPVRGTGRSSRSPRWRATGSANGSSSGSARSLRRARDRRSAAPVARPADVRPSSTRVVVARSTYAAASSARGQYDRRPLLSSSWFRSLSDQPAHFATSSSAAVEHRLTRIVLPTA